MLSPDQVEQLAADFGFAVPAWLAEHAKTMREARRLMARYAPRPFPTKALRS